MGTGVGWGTKELFGVMNILIILTVAVISWVDTHVKTHQIIHFITF